MLQLCWPPSDYKSMKPNVSLGREEGAVIMSILRFDGYSILLLRISHHWTLCFIVG